MLQRTIVLPFEILYLHYLTVMVVLFFVNRDWNINLSKILFIMFEFYMLYLQV